MHIGKIGQKSAAFIIHKPFHPGSFKNLEKVWIAEQKNAEAQRKQQELLDQRLQEGKIEELRRALYVGEREAGSSVSSTTELQWVAGDESGQLPGVPSHMAREISNNKLDWMYYHASAGKSSATDRFCLVDTLGAAEDATSTVADAQVNDSSVNAPLNELNSLSDLSLCPGLSESDMLRKVKEDPMFAIKQAELAHKKALGVNPLIRARLREKEERRAQRLERKEHRHARRERRSSYADSLVNTQKPANVGVQADEETILSLRNESGQRERERLGPTAEMIESLSRRKREREESKTLQEDEEADGDSCLDSLEQMIARADRRKEDRRKKLKALEDQEKSSSNRDRTVTSYDFSEPSFLTKARRDYLDDFVATRDKDRDKLRGERNPSSFDRRLTSVD